MPTEVPQSQRTDRTKPLLREAAFSSSSIDHDKRTVELSFSSEAPVSRYDWWTGESYQEILSHDEGAMDLERINTVGIVAFNHNTYSLPLGSVERAWLDAGTRKGRAVLRFDADPAADAVWQKILSGTLRGVSFRYDVGIWEDVKAGKQSTCGRFTGPCMVGRDWTPYEIGPVGLPADYTVGVGRSVDDMPETPEQRRDPSMSADAEVTIDTAAIRTEGVAAERQRVSEITDLCREFAIDAKEYIDGGTTVEDVRKAVIGKLAAERKAIPVAPTVSVTVDESDKLRAAAVDSIMLRGGLTVTTPSPGASDFRGYSLMDLAREALERAGISVRGKGRMDIVREAIIGTSDFPYILADSANKSMLMGYQMAPTTWQIWMRKGSLSDFKTANRLHLSEADDVKVVFEGAEFKHNAPMAESREQLTLVTYGALDSITRQAIINDDLSALTAKPQRMGQAAKRKVNAVAYEVLTGTATMSDGEVLFHANHGNLAGAAAALSVASLGLAQAAMRIQKNLLTKEIVGVAPQFLVVSPVKEVEAKQLINSTVDPTKSNATVNPFSGALTVVVEPILTGNAWFLAASQSIFDTIEVAFLNGNEEPYMEERKGFEVDGLEYKVRLDFTAKALDWRGVYKNAGA